MPADPWFLDQGQSLKLLDIDAAGIARGDSYAELREMVFESGNALATALFASPYNAMVVAKGLVLLASMLNSFDQKKVTTTSRRQATQKLMGQIGHAMWTRTSESFDCLIVYSGTELVISCMSMKMAWDCMFEAMTRSSAVILGKLPELPGEAEWRSKDDSASTCCAKEVCLELTQARASRTSLAGAIQALTEPEAKDIWKKRKNCMVNT